MKLREYVEKLIQMELDAAKLYEEIEQVTSEEIAVAARTFKEEEYSHADILKKIFLNLPPEELSKEVNSSSVNDHELNSSIEAEDESLQNRKNFFLFALQGEKDSLELYGKLKRLFKDDETLSKTFDNLLLEERKHMYFILKNLHEMK